MPFIGEAITLTVVAATSFKLGYNFGYKIGYKEAAKDMELLKKRQSDLEEQCIFFLFS